MGYVSSAGSTEKPGDVKMVPVNAVPLGWIKANGAAISRTTYAGLFAAIGTAFGAGDGVTTFNVPDLRGEFPRFFDDGRGVDAARAIGSWQAQDVVPHTHALNGTTGVSYGILNAGGTGNIYSGGGGSGAYDVTTGKPTGSAGTTETRPRNVALLAVIKY